MSTSELSSVLSHSDRVLQGAPHPPDLFIRGSGRGNRMYRNSFISRFRALGYLHVRIWHVQDLMSLSLPPLPYTSAYPPRTYLCNKLSHCLVGLAFLGLGSHA